MRRTLMIAATAIAIAAVARAQDPDFPEACLPSEEMIEIAAILRWDAQDIAILNLSDLFDDPTGDRLRFRKVRHLRTGERRFLVLDDDGEEADLGVVGDLLAARRRATRGHLSAALDQVLAHRQQDAQAPPATIPVVARIRTARPPVDRRQFGRRPDMNLVRDAARQHWAAESAEASRKLGIIMARVPGPPPVVRDVTGSFIGLDATPAAIELLRNHPDVLFVGLDRQEAVEDFPATGDEFYFPPIEEVLPRTRTDEVHVSTKGGDVTLAVVEPGTLTKGLDCFNMDLYQDPDAAPNLHATQGVGMVCNRFQEGPTVDQCAGAEQGYACGTRVVMANAGTHEDYRTQALWAVDEGNASVLSMAWHFATEEEYGDLDGRDHFFDVLASSPPWPSVFTSAGNKASDLEFDNKHASGKGFNFMGVGNMAIDSNLDRCDDSIYPTSSFKNPWSLHGDRELPEIVMPGSRYTMFEYTFGQTSAATPAAASIASLLISAEPSLLIQPTAVRAILLASAHHVDAPAEAPLSSDRRDGAGLVDAVHAHRMATRYVSGATPAYRGHRCEDVFGTSFDDEGVLTRAVVETCTAGARLRAAVAWNSLAVQTDDPLAPELSELTVDLDLYVIDELGVVRGESVSWDDSYEVVDVEVAAPGEYTVIVVDGRFWPGKYTADASQWTTYGLAWSNHYDAPCP